MSESLIKFHVDDMVFATEHLVGGRILQELEGVDPHTSYQDRVENTSIGFELNTLVRNYCVQNGILPENQGSRLSIFRDGNLLEMKHDEVTESALTTQRTINDLVHRLFLLSHESAETPFECEFETVANLHRKIKMFNHAYYCAFEEVHGLHHDSMHEILQSDDFMFDCAAFPLDVISTADGALSFSPYKTSSLGPLLPNSRLMEAIRKLYAQIIKTAHTQFLSPGHTFAPRMKDRLKKYIQLHRLFGSRKQQGEFSSSIDTME